MRFPISIREAKSPRESASRNRNRLATHDTLPSFPAQNTKDVLYLIQREPALDQALVPGRNPDLEYINQNKERAWNSPLVPDPGTASESINQLINEWNEQ